jgi:3-oxoacyl-[acyl-carrier-protein] synthase-3
MVKTFTGVKITGVAAAVPPTILEVKDLSRRFPAVDFSRITAKTGVNQVRVTDVTTTTSDLCFAAAKKLLSDLEMSAESVDALVFVSGSPDYLFPPTSHFLPCEKWPTFTLKNLKKI